MATLMIATDTIGASYAGARGGVQGFFGALYRGTDYVLGPARRWVAAVPHLGSDTTTIDRLRARVAALERTDSQRGTDAATLAQLAKLQLQATRGGYSVLPARVVAIGPGDGFSWTVTLDAGSADKVKLGQTVIAGAALVGRVIRVSPTSATVLLAADPGSGVGVRDERTGQVGLVTGRGSAGFTYAPLDPNATVRAGDVLVSGPARSSTYIAGLTVGTVTTSGTGAVRVTPATSPTSLDLVGVILLGGTAGPRQPLRPGAAADGQR